MSLITLPHAVFIFDTNGNAVPVVSGSAITSGSHGFIIFGEDGNGETRQFSVDASGSLSIQDPPNLDVALSTRLSEVTFTGRINTLGQKAMTGSTPVVIASDQSSVLVESVISDHSSSFAGVVTSGTRTALSVEYPALLWEMKKITRELSIMRKHLETITEEEWDE